MERDCRDKKRYGEKAFRMKWFFKKVIALLYFFAGFISVGQAQGIVINEIQSSNVNTFYDHRGDTPDWIEIYNTGSATVNLDGYGLSDADSLPMKWTFPNVLLPAHGFLLVCASGLDLKAPSLYWETIIDMGDEWKYLVPTSEVTPAWKNTGFDDQAWSIGKSGFGYGDGDDSTKIDVAMSIFIRKRFTVSNKDDIIQAYLHIDFDDAFVAYLNGNEVARANIGKKGIPPAFDEPADDYDHEAAMYQGGRPDEFLIDSVYKYLKDGENILAIEVHNHSLSSSDMTAIPFFTIGMATNPGYAPYISPYIDLVPVGLHTNFKISSSGEHIILSNKDGEQVDSVFTGKIPADISLGRKPDGSSAWMFFDQPTPGTSNTSEGYIPVPVNPVRFSIQGGYYQGDLNLRLYTGDPADSIYYTLDGGEPGRNDHLYSSGITIAKTTTVRARVIRSGFLPGEIGTNTYLLNELHDLPVVTVTTDPYNLWDEDYGIYVMGKNASEEYPYKGANFWQDWERPANIAMYEPDGRLAFQLDAGIKIFGNWSRGQDQKSLSIHARKSYGYDAIHYRIFDEKDIDEFKTILLRNSGNDFRGTMLRDAYADRILLDLHLDYQAYRPAVVYLNGEYWGIMNLREKINEEFIHYNHGIDEDLVDILEFNGSVVKGNNENYKALLDYLKSHNLDAEDHYKYVTDQIDVENYIKYQVANIFIDNQDWPGNNIKYWRERSNRGKWRWIVFDLDAAFSAWFDDHTDFNTLEYALDPDGPGWPNPPWSTFLFRKMMENKSFEYDFINCFADNLNTIFQPDILEKKLDEIKTVIEPEMPRHLERWNTGDMGAWNYRINKIREFVKNRSKYVWTHIKKQFHLSGTYNLNVEAIGGGYVRLNTITLHDFPWSGRYFKNVPVKMEAIPEPGHRFVKWEGIETYDREHLTLNADTLTEVYAVFMPYEDQEGEVVINEINYHSGKDFDPGDWVELFNVSDYAINVSGWVLRDSDDGHAFVMPEGTVIDSHGFLVVCRNKDKFENLFPSVSTVEGEMDFGFSSKGDCVRLFNSIGDLMDEVCYENDDPWPAGPDGGGKTLALLNTLGDNEQPANWRSSIGHGTPGTKNLDIITGLGSGMNEITTVPKITVFPNPTKGHITVRMELSPSEEVSFMLYDITGRAVGNMVNYTVSEGDQELDLDLHKLRKNIFSGVYILRIESASVKMSQRIIIQ